MSWYDSEVVSRLCRLEPRRELNARRLRARLRTTHHLTRWQRAGRRMVVATMFALLTSCATLSQFVATQSEWLDQRLSTGDWRAIAIHRIELKRELNLSAG